MKSGDIERQRDTNDKRRNERRVYESDKDREKNEGEIKIEICR
jgi:hypothetical protein